MRLKKPLSKLFLILAAVLSFAFPSPARPRPGGQTSRAAAELSGTVVHVYDGDTVRVRLPSGEEKRVRLIGVDSPEFTAPEEKGRLSAFLARRFVYARLYQKSVRLTFDKDEVDAYGRLLAYVWTDERTMFNETLVREGYASAYLKYPFDEGWRKKFKDAEGEARSAEKGLWRKKPYETIAASDAAAHLGEVVSVRFRCIRFFDRSRFRVLVPAEGNFEAVIPLDALAAFPGSLDYENRDVEVTGLVEEFRGRPQIVVGIPAQIRSVVPKESP